MGVNFFSPSPFPLSQCPKVLFMMYPYKRSPVHYGCFYYRAIYLTTLNITGSSLTNIKITGARTQGLAQKRYLSLLKIIFFHPLETRRFSTSIMAFLP
jgi:hypothetical protein